MDITAGGGSIPFEAGRLGLHSIANEINPVAATLILRATCQWPQAVRIRPVLDVYSGVSTRFRKRVNELLDGSVPCRSRSFRMLRNLQEIRNDARPKVRPNVPLGARRFLSFM